MVRLDEVILIFRIKTLQMNSIRRPLGEDESKSGHAVTWCMRVSLFVNHPRNQFSEFAEFSIPVKSLAIVYGNFYSLWKIRQIRKTAWDSV